MAEKPRKRKRTTTVSHACSNCRASHLKCDGAFPCGRCQKKNLQCHYTENSKRGPVAHARITALEKQVASLQNEINYWKSLCQITTTKENMANCSKEVHFSISTLITQYIESYESSFYSWHGTPIQNLDHNTVFSIIHSEDSELASKKLFVYSLISYISQISGHVARTEEFFGTAKSLLRDLYYVRNLYTAASFFLVSQTFSGLNDFDHSLLYRVLSMDCCKSLLSRYGMSTQFPQRNSITKILRACLLVAAHFQSSSRKSIKQFSKIQTLVEAFDSSGRQRDEVDKAQYCWAAINKVWTETNTNSEYFKLQWGEHTTPNITVSDCGPILTKLDNYWQESQTLRNVYWKTLFERLIMGIKANLSLKMGNHNLARKLADETLNSCKFMPIDMQAAHISAFFNIAEVFLEVNYNSFLEVLGLFQKLLEKFPWWVNPYYQSLVSKKKGRGTNYQNT